MSTLTVPSVSPESTRRLRDLSDSEFKDTYGCDRFSASVILNRLRYAVEHMSTGFMREAFSPIIRDWYDFACTISGPADRDYPMAVVSNSLVVFLGTMGDAVRNAVEEYGPENLRPGDVLICNDPYRGGRHVNDVAFTRPVFVDGKIVSYVNLCAHQLDMGGTVPGGFSATKSNVYENGLVIPPMLLWSEDKPVRSTFSLIFDNTRWGGMLLPDFKSIYQQLKLGERLILENIDRYGLDSYLGTLDYSCDTSAERMRDAIGRVPDGDYAGSALIDADGLDDTLDYTVRVLVRKRGDDIEVDLSGTSAQARTCINCGVLDAKTAVGVALTILLDPKVPFTSGTWRNIDIAAPAGTIVSSLPPDGGIMMFWEASGAIASAIFDALNPVLGVQGVGGDYGSTNTHNASGVRPDGTPWTSATQCGGEHGPWGASKAGDGDSYTVLLTLNNLDPATETIEHDSPVVVLRKEHAIDTGGAGTFRGGAANLKDTLWLTAGQHYLSPFRTKKPSGVGANGGNAGPNGAMWLFPPTTDAPVKGLVDTADSAYEHSEPVAGVLNPSTHALDPENGEYNYFARRQVWATAPNTILRCLTNGGGGWGDPFARDPERVLADVRNEYVSIEAAAAQYGVVVVGDPRNDPEGLRIDVAGTDALRGKAQ
ncbi:hydantoinase B/oxoprolinase family protein [Rhodococcus oxybenzonivorans]|uniref:hydantoinase B/oxoprolinase family protein n=1 Tax=Rhodococcus oxybenzonivorans TaxID=1990687 RepID=UPI002954CDEB|nr:hydantoinase B/oxoprolinase family protein [Rhodococcus oxybenzonivorans]MDV7351981.1 hydantoinase B/oxoprolinase family protein [Rhodococcus oxybenzonivorans]